ncbi:MAG TPA: hypothetical protein VE999_10890 [Gemmataceae bacterium]|nr:hypothetical protein [Gemmataceae bacterium]
MQFELISARRSILITACQPFGGMGQGLPGPRMQISAKVAEEAGGKGKLVGLTSKKNMDRFVCDLPTFIDGGLILGRAALLPRSLRPSGRGPAKRFHHVVRRDMIIIAISTLMELRSHRGSACPRRFHPGAGKIPSRPTAGVVLTTESPDPAIKS